jgi:hypothetical protein
VVYMSENRSLAVLEILVHLSDVLPDKYVLGSADLPDDGRGTRSNHQGRPRSEISGSFRMSPSA